MLTVNKVSEDRVKCIQFTKTFKQFLSIVTKLIRMVPSSQRSLFKGGSFSHKNNFEWGLLKRGANLKVGAYLKTYSMSLKNVFLAFNNLFTALYFYIIRTMDLSNC